MKAALINRYGSNDVVSVVDIDVPAFGATDLLVRVHAASVNPVDIKTREGRRCATHSLTPSPGGRREKRSSRLCECCAKPPCGPLNRRCG